MFLYGDIRQMVIAELKSLRRWNEYLVFSINEEIDVMIEHAQRMARETDRLPPMHSNIVNFKSELIYDRAKVFGYYFMPMTWGEACREVGERKWLLQFGKMLSLIYAQYLMQMSDKIKYFVENIATYIHYEYRDGRLREEDVVTYLRRECRMVVGHERRHKMQQRMREASKDGTILLSCEPDRDDHIERDAWYWQWNFNNNWFGDQVMKI